MRVASVSEDMSLGKRTVVVSEGLRAKPAGLARGTEPRGRAALLSATDEGRGKGGKGKDQHGASGRHGRG